MRTRASSKRKETKREKKEILEEYGRQKGIQNTADNPPFECLLLNLFLDFVDVSPSTSWFFPFRPMPSSGKPASPTSVLEGLDMFDVLKASSPEYELVRFWEMAMSLARSIVSSHSCTQDWAEVGSLEVLVSSNV